jgi:ribonuclease J
MFKRGIHHKEHQRERQKLSRHIPLRVAVLGGLEEVGRNMTVVEYKDDILIIDMGLQFPEEDMPGIDYIIPNINSLKPKSKNIRGVIITHGHYDHIGAIPHLMKDLGNPVIYTLPFTAEIIRKRQEEFGKSDLRIQEVKLTDKIVLGSFQVEFFRVNHNIPDSMAVAIHTPYGTIVHTGDWKFDYSPIDGLITDFAKIVHLGEKGVLALMGDSTNAGQAGHQISECDIGETLEAIFINAKGRIIVGTFSSLLSRIRQVIEIAEKLGKKVAIDGYSMKTNVEIARRMAYIKPHQNTLIDISKINNIPDEKVVILCTGAQGEEQAVLMRIANGEHKYVQIKKGDTVIFSSSIIPGNERTIQRLRDTLVKKGAEIIHYQMMDVHAGGHARNDDIKLLLLLLKPKYYIPIEGNQYLLRENAKVAESIGFKSENILIALNGQVIEFNSKGIGVLTNNFLPSDYVFVDGLGVGDVSEIVLRDRKVLARDGMVVVIATVNGKTGDLVGSPDIISRGFVYLKENKKLIEDVRERVRRIIRDKDPQSPVDNMYLRNRIRNEIGEFLFRRTERRPMVLPVVIEV